jgi:hypothetical protein
MQEDIPNEPVLKVWALDKPVKKTGIPTCQSTLSIQNGRKPFPVRASWARTRADIVFQSMLSPNYIADPARIDLGVHGS